MRCRVDAIDRGGRKSLRVAVEADDGMARHPCFPSVALATASGMAEIVWIERRRRGPNFGPVALIGGGTRRRASSFCQIGQRIGGGDFISFKTVVACTSSAAEDVGKPSTLLTWFRIRTAGRQDGAGADVGHFLRGGSPDRDWPLRR